MSPPFTNALIHLLGSVFRITPTSRIYQALVLGEVFSTSQLASLNQATILAMTYEADDGERTLAAPQRLHLTQAVAWMRHQRVHVGRPLLPSDWLNYTADNFDDFVDDLIQEEEDYDQAAPLPNITNYTPTSNPALDF